MKDPTIFTMLQIVLLMCVVRVDSFERSPTVRRRFSSEGFEYNSDIFAYNHAEKQSRPCVSCRAFVPASTIFFDEDNFNLINRLTSTEARQKFLEDIVVDSTRVSWKDVIRTISLLIKDGGPEWTFGCFDQVNQSLQVVIYDKKSASVDSERLTNSLQSALESFVDSNDDLAMSLLIANIRERVEDEWYDNRSEADEDKDIEFVFGDPENDISYELDKLRREVAFKALCILRFVRTGFPKL